MNECKFCGSEWKSYNALHNHERQCKNNPNGWWTEDRRKKAADKTKEAHKSATYIQVSVCCVRCKREISTKQIANHYNSELCIGYIRKRKEKQECEHCGVIPKKTMADHYKICRKNPDNKKPLVWTEERRKKHSDAMKRAVKENPDSYSKNNVCGRVKITEYKDGINLKGSWEVKVAEWLDAQGIRWENEVNPKPYYWNGDWKLYFPDFYLIDYECYIEVKGYRTDRDVAKWNHFDCDLLVFENEAINKLDQIDIHYALAAFRWDVCRSWSSALGS